MRSFRFREFTQRPACAGRWLLSVLAWVALTAAVAAQNAPPALEKIAVMDLRGVGTSDAEREAITDRLREVLLKTGRYTLVDRSQMEAILNEQALQQTTCTEEQCALEVGKILGVGKIVAGKIVKLGADRWQVSALMLDVRTAVTARADSVRFQGDVFGLLDTQLPLLGQRLAGPDVAAAGTAAVAAPATAAMLPAVPAGPGLQQVRGAWSDGPSLGVGRARHGAVALGAQVIVIGGEGERGDPLASVEVLDPGAKQWREVQPMPEPRSGVAAAVLGGRVYAVGGRGGRRVSSRVDVYDPAADRWDTGPALPSGREGAVALASMGRLFVVGGMNDDGESIDEVLALDPGTQQWQALSPLTSPRGYAVGAAAGGRLLVLGGRRGAAGLMSLMGSVMVKEGEAFDVGANRWEPLPEMPKGLVGMSGGLVGDRMYIFGGLSGSFAVMTPQGRYEAYDVGRNTWGEGGRMPTGRAEHASVVLPDRVLIIGGKPNQYRTVTELR